MSGIALRASAMPSGSKARMVAPAACSAGRMARLGLSRMSSVLGLKVRPSVAMVQPATLPPQAAITRSAMLFLRRSLTSTTASMSCSGAPACLAVLGRASVELGGGVGRRDAARPLAAGPHGDRRLGDDDGVAGERRGDLLGGGEDIAEMGMAVAAPAGRADGDEHRVGPRRGRRQVGP